MRPLLALLLCLFIGAQSISATHTDSHHHHKDATPPFSTGMYVIESQHSNKVLQSSKTGHILQNHLDSDHNNKFQRFYLIHLEGDTYYLIGGHNRKMIEVTADGTAPQERRDFSFGDEDRWRVSVKPEGGFSFQHLQSGKYLAAKHTGVHMVATDDESGTAFKVHKNIDNGVYKIKAKDSSHYLHFDNNRVFLKSHPDASTAGKFFIKTHGLKHLSIVDFKTNHALTHDLSSPHLTHSPYTGEDSQKLVSLLEGGHHFKFQSSSSEHLLARCELEEGDDAESRLCLSSEGIEGAFELIQELTAPLMKFNERAYLSTQNSYSSLDNGFNRQQDGSITYQLEHGVRSVNFDIWSIDPDFPPKGKTLTDPLIACPAALAFLNYDEAGIYVFHNIREYGCIPGITMPYSTKPLRLSDLMQEVVDFLNKNPEEIVIIDFEDDGWWDGEYPPGPEYNLLVAEYARVKGLDKLTYNLDTDPVLSVAESRSWPLIQNMVALNKRLIMFPKRNYYSKEKA